MHQRDDDIYASAPLRRLLDEQTRALRPELQRCHGMHGLLLRACGDDRPPALPMLRCWTSLHLDGAGYGGDLRAAANEPLPFVDDAFDLALLRHVLEVAPNAPALLDDAVRILAPGGVLVLTGVHPISGWAPWFYWRTRGESRVLQMPLHLGHDLRQAGLEIECMQRVGRAWPSQERPGSARGSAFGGGYILIARKRRRMATPLRIKPVPVTVPSNGQLSPGARRSSAS
ncbi:class I SAM-dependent methyltransferase [Rhodanobacter umsongensis]|uniref:Class I SAM-dependent methyltransferase n=1 Tax=Rhodanobacter umsongensis TaxID=633153 RepID=A0ABW0JHE7_9GAMM